MNKKLLRSLGQLPLFACFILYACGTDRQEQNQAQKVIPQALSAVDFTPKQGLTPESQISITAKMASDTSRDVQIDSVAAMWNGQSLRVASDPTFTLPLTGITLGRQEIVTTVFLSNGETEKHYLRLSVLAPSPPVQYTFRKLNTFPHDPDAYTQGLFFREGFLYESTGQEGKSSLRKVELASGKVLKQINLDDRYFGEGITHFDGQIIQLTYTSNQGFVYNLETFEQIKTFNYPTEGWGLEILGEELIMTDGTEYIYFLDPYTFSETGRIQVYNHEGKVDQLNELEVIDGKIYANVYQTDKIVMIDPATGMVEGEVNLEGIFNAQGYNRELDVLNGIAWDGRNRALYVTGKLWPKLFQIEIVEIQS